MQFFFLIHLAWGSLRGMNVWIHVFHKAGRNFDHNFINSFSAPLCPFSLPGTPVTSLWDGVLLCVGHEASVRFSVSDFLFFTANSLHDHVSNLPFWASNILLSWSDDFFNSLIALFSSRRSTCFFFIVSISSHYIYVPFKFSHILLRARI